jgi:hypothetical protein
MVNEGIYAYEYAPASESELTTSSEALKAFKHAWKHGIHTEAEKGSHVAFAL